MELGGEDLPDGGKGREDKTYLGHNRKSSEAARVPSCLGEAGPPEGFPAEETGAKGRA